MTLRGLLIAGVLSVTAASASAANLDECVSIKDDAVRLFCYDRVAGRTPTAADIPASAATVVPPAAAAPAEIPKRIESRIVGSFDGWRQGTRFKLENGQTWEAIGTGTFNTRKMDAPPVVLERDFLGQMKLAVDGVKSRAAVRLLDAD